MRIIHLCFFLLVFNNTTNAQKFYDIIGKAKRLITDAIQDADRSANYTVDHTANELNVLVNTASQLFGDQMDKDVSKLKEAARKIADKINDLNNQIESGQGAIVHLADNLTLDINDMLGNTFFSKKEFILQRISGLNHLYKNSGVYQIVLTGSNFGFSSNNVKATFVKVSIENNDITKFINLDQNIDVNTKKININASILNRYFVPKKLKSVKITFEIKREELKGVLEKKWKETARINNSIYIFLFPNYSGKFKFDLSSEEYGWVKVGDISEPRTGPDSPCPDDCDKWQGNPIDWSIDVNGGNIPPKIGDFKLTNPTIVQTNGPLGWDLNLKASLLNCDAQGQNCTRAIAHFQARTSPTTYLLSATKWIYQTNGDGNSSEIKEFVYDRIYKLPYPKSVKSITISGRSPADGEDFNYNINESNPIFTLVSLDEINGQNIYQFKLKRPGGQ